MGVNRSIRIWWNNLDEAIKELKRLKLITDDTPIKELHQIIKDKQEEFSL